MKINYEDTLLNGNLNLFNMLSKLLIENNISISTMESCTSGLLATMITNTPGASEIFKGSFVTYSNEAKIKQGVSEKTIKTYGVYSEQTAIEMALACKDAYKSDIGVGVTGVIDRVDPNNEGYSIYYSFVFKNDTLDTLMSHTDIIFIPNEITDRFGRKLFVSKEICKDLIIALQNLILLNRKGE